MVPRTVVTNKLTNRREETLLHIPFCTFHSVDMHGLCFCWCSNSSPCGQTIKRQNWEERPGLEKRSILSKQNLYPNTVEWENHQVQVTLKLTIWRQNKEEIPRLEEGSYLSTQFFVYYWQGNIMREPSLSAHAGEKYWATESGRETSAWWRAQPINERVRIRESSGSAPVGEKFSDRFRKINVGLKNDSSFQRKIYILTL